MVMILLNWLYMAVTTFLTGYGIMGLFARLFGYKVRNVIGYFLAGLVCTTVYAEVYSLFGGVSVTANILLCIICLVIVAVYKKDLTSLFGKAGETLVKEKWRIPVGIVFLLLFSYGTSRGYMHFDTSLYHAQSIRWIEEYGVVPGLGNLQARFGYNSAAFALTALYSMKGVFGQSLHATAGFFALLSAFIAFDIRGVFGKRNIRLSDFIRVGLIFYLSVIFSEMMSPASDYYAMLLLFDVLILWLDEDDWQSSTETQNPTAYGLLCVLLVYAVTVKFSVALLLLLVIKPAMMLIKNKDVKQIFVFLGSGLLVSVPFFIRNVIISGWLIYPAPWLDLFSVDWKIPKQQVEFDATEIGVYGKGLYDVSKQNAPLSEWVLPWFEQLKALEKLFVLATVAAVVAGLVYLCRVLIRTIAERKKGHGTRSVLWNAGVNFAFVFAVFVVGACFWFFSAPLVRYGYAYIVAVPLLVFGFFFLQIPGKKEEAKQISLQRILFLGVFVLFLITRIKGLAEDISRTYKQPYYLSQTDYEDGEAEIQTVGGITFYVPTDRGLIGYDKFPASLFVFPIELRGESIEDGFRQIGEE